MCLGALIHAGVPLAYLTEQLATLGISQEYHLWSELVHRNGQQATKVHVELLHPDSEPRASQQSVESGVASGVERSHPAHHPADHSHSHPHPASAEHRHSHPVHSQQVGQGHAHHPHPDHHHHHHPEGTRHLPEIERLILAAQLPERVQHWSLAIFRRLAEAEGAVHGISPEQVHFHEVGATDAIVDIVGTCLGLDYLGMDTLFCSALPVGGGTVWAAHGRLPVPPPAVLKLFELAQVPLYSNGIDRELVTPTGAAIVTTLASSFGAPPPLQLHKVGLGAGSRELPIPNILRLWIGESHTEGKPSTTPVDQTTAKSVWQSPTPTLDRPPHAASESESIGQLETVAVLETQIDDLSPQAIGYTMTTLLAAGALDVFTQAIGMKKSRPGVLLTVICRPEQAATCEAILFRETTTLGIRHSRQQRTALQRTLETVETPYGLVRVKIARHNQGSVVNVQPEFEDCARLAQQQQIPWREVQRMALQSWYGRQQAKDSAN